MFVIDALNYAFSLGAITIEDAVEMVKKAVRILERAGKEFIFVFDGKSDKYSSGKRVVWVGFERKADDWIINFVSKNPEKRIVVITRDKELAEKVKWISKNVIVWDTEEFDRYLRGLEGERETKIYQKFEVETSKEGKEMLENFNEEEFSGAFQVKFEESVERGKLKKKEEIYPPTDMDFEEFSRKFEEILRRFGKGL
jgi:uncharacterized protein YaiI (UPF0178 family)